MRHHAFRLATGVPVDETTESPRILGLAVGEVPGSFARGPFAACLGLLPLAAGNLFLVPTGRPWARPTRRSRTHPPRDQMVGFLAGKQCFRPRSRRFAALA